MQIGLGPKSHKLQDVFFVNQSQSTKVLSYIINPQKFRFIDKLLKDEQTFVVCLSVFTSHNCAKMYGFLI